MRHIPPGRPIRHLTTERHRRSTRVAPRASAAARLAWRAALPWFSMAIIVAVFGVLLVIIGQSAATHSPPTLTETLTPVGIMLLTTALAPLVLGAIRLMATEPSQANRRCGRCQFYRAAHGTYSHGVCTVERQVQLTFRTELCERFVESERAMVRDRLSDAPHILNSARRPSHE